MSDISADAKYEIAKREVARRLEEWETLRQRVAVLQEALTDAVQTAEACKAFVDIQVDARFVTGRANWKQAAIACHDEIDSRPKQWRQALADGEIET